MQRGLNQVLGQAAQQFAQGVVDNAVSEIIDNADALIMEALFKQSDRFSQQVVDSAHRTKAGYEAVRAPEFGIRKGGSSKLKMYLIQHSHPMFIKDRIIL